MAFYQTAPNPGNPFTEDRVLLEYWERNIPTKMREELRPELEALGTRISEELRPYALAHRKEEPTLTQWDAWGNRVDRIAVPEAWEFYGRLATEEGLIWRAYDPKYGAFARIDQFTRAYLLDRVTHTYNCPLAMTDGTVRTLLFHGNKELQERALPHLLSRTPGEAWTAGQWMTERTGGSDVGLTETQAQETSEGWKLSGTKWFTSATTSEIALTLARPKGNPSGGKGLALFYVEQRNEEGKLNGIEVNRLKEKLGTWMLPTAELTLRETPATPVAGLENGIRNIAPLLNVTRTWNSVCALASMRHGILLARDYAKRRHAFGTTLSEQPLHIDTLAGMQAEFEAAFHLTFELVRLLGKSDQGETTEREKKALRLLFPIVKLLTAKMAVANASETLEAFGGAGYVEDTGIPQLLRDTQVLSIWEGTTNVLSLDGLRAISKEDALPSYLEILEERATHTLRTELKPLGLEALAGAQNASKWLQDNLSSPAAIQAGARRFAITLGRSMALALLIDHADWAWSEKGDQRAALAAKRFAQNGIESIQFEPVDLKEMASLANDVA